MAGTSGRPLYLKLGIKTDISGVLIDAPENYLALLGPGAPDISWKTEPFSGCAFAHLFCTDRNVLEKSLPQILERMDRSGMIWVSWPKKASKVPTTVTEDVIREVALPLGLVDTKVCAVDSTWSGLKLVIRKELR
ncbi:DUF3052 family protein [Cognatishimia sp.]|uniref:DUF3052 family protein n=1 Tax=Cognatishimia sp. TaxID=2211648 RepID=UPI003BAB43D1